MANNYPNSSINNPRSLHLVSERFDSRTTLEPTLALEKLQNFHHRHGLIPAEKYFPREVETIHPSTQHHIALLPRVDFPIFNGEDPRFWINEANKYFQKYSTFPEDRKVDLAAYVYFDGDARIWCMEYLEERGTPTWDDFVSMLLKKFELNWVNSKQAVKEFEEPCVFEKVPARVINEIQLFDEVLGEKLTEMEVTEVATKVFEKIHVKKFRELKEKESGSMVFDKMLETKVKEPDETENAPTIFQDVPTKEFKVWSVDKFDNNFLSDVVYDRQLTMTIQGVVPPPSMINAIVCCENENNSNTTEENAAISLINARLSSHYNRESTTIFIIDPGGNIACKSDSRLLGTCFCERGLEYLVSWYFDVVRSKRSVHTFGTTCIEIYNEDLKLDTHEWSMLQLLTKISVGKRKKELEHRENGESISLILTHWQKCSFGTIDYGFKENLQNDIWLKYSAHVDSMEILGASWMLMVFLEATGCWCPCVESLNFYVSIFFQFNCRMLLYARTLVENQHHDTEVNVVFLIGLLISFEETVKEENYPMARVTVDTIHLSTVQAHLIEGKKLGVGDYLLRTRDMRLIELILIISNSWQKCMNNGILDDWFKEDLQNFLRVKYNACTDSMRALSTSIYVVLSRAFDHTSTYAKKFHLCIMGYSASKVYIKGMIGNQFYVKNDRIICLVLLISFKKTSRYKAGQWLIFTMESFQPNILQLHYLQIKWIGATEFMMKNHVIWLILTAQASNLRSWFELELICKKGCASVIFELNMEAFIEIQGNHLGIESQKTIDGMLECRMLSTNDGLEISYATIIMSIWVYACSRQVYYYFIRVTEFAILRIKLELSLLTHLDIHIKNFTSDFDVVEVKRKPAHYWVTKYNAVEQHLNLERRPKFHPDGCLYSLIALWIRKYKVINLILIYLSRIWVGTLPLKLNALSEAQRSWSSMHIEFSPIGPTTHAKRIGSHKSKSGTHADYLIYCWVTNDVVWHLICDSIVGEAVNVKIHNMVSQVVNVASCGIWKLLILRAMNQLELGGNREDFHIC